MNGAELDNDELFDRLLNEPVEALRSRWDDIAGEIDDIAEQEAELASRRERLEVRRAVLNVIADLRRVELPDEASRAEEEGDGTSPRAVAAALLAEAPRQVWNAQELHDAMDERGIDTSRSNVRMILQRLVRDGKARRVSYGRYQSAQQSDGTLPGMNGGERT